MIQFKKFTKAQAKEFADEIDKLSPAAFEDRQAQWNLFSVGEFDASYSALRKSIIDTYKQYKDAGDYERDIRVGLRLYKELDPKTVFTTIAANDDNIWRYLSCVVFPDITYLRYKPSTTDINEGHRLNAKRFYSHTRRIWLKTLWWYIHLSWQGSEDKTYKAICGLGTDTISDLIERPGKGYRLPLYRSLMKEYAKVGNKNSDLFNRIQKQNLVNCRSVEPALTEGAEGGYIKRLIQQSVR